MVIVRQLPRRSAKQAGQQGDQGGAQQDDAAAGHELFHTKIIETANGGRRRGPYGLPLIPLLSS